MSSQGNDANGLNKAAAGAVPPGEAGATHAAGGAEPIGAAPALIGWAGYFSP